MNKLLKNKDIYAIIFIYIIVALFYHQSQGMKEDAGLFPSFLSILIFILNTLYLFNISRTEIKEVQKNKDEISFKKLYIMIGLSIFYIGLLKVLGFTIASFIFLIISMKLLEVNNNKLVIISSLLIVIIIYICFAILLNVPMPMGMLV